MTVVIHYPLMNCMSFGETIKRLRLSRGWTQQQLAQRAAASEKSISVWEDLKVASVQGIKYFNLAKAFGMTPSELDREWRPTKIEQSIGDPIRRGIPVINKAPAGNITPYEECSTVDTGQGHWYVPRDGLNDPNAFAVVITGDSMLPTLGEGDVCYFSPMDMDGHIHHDRSRVNDGRIVFVRFAQDSTRDGCTVARVHRTKHGIELRKDNKSHKPIRPDTGEIILMAALVRHDFAGSTKMLPANEQLAQAGSREGQVHPEDTPQVSPED